MKNATNFNEFYNNIESPFIRSESELWDKISDQIETKPQVNIFQLSWIKYAAAATIFFLIGSTLFMKLYTTNIVSEKGEHLSHILPDGSAIELNADTYIAYQPYWWVFNREITLSGEAFFNVEKGEKFKIISENGITEIFGTSFNIYARNSEYEVFCETGKVKVSSTKSDIKFIIEAGELAVINNLKRDGRKSEANVSDYTAWKDNKFVFTSVQIQNVLDELERQYNVKIILERNNSSELLYTGNFKKTISVEPALSFVCKSFGLTFVKAKSRTYKIF